MKSQIEPKHTLTISRTVLWTSAYFILLLFITALDMFLFRKFPDYIEALLNILTALICNGLFYYALRWQTGFRIYLFRNITMKGILLAIGCSILFFLLLDNFFDPIFESFFPTSEADYQDMLLSLRQTPISSFLRICLIAPITEEILMRGYILGGLFSKYGAVIALLVSALLFAYLHFNMVQTISALFCGIILGLIYLKTGSVFCCILSHFLYNTISTISFFLILY